MGCRRWRRYGLELCACCCAFNARADQPHCSRYHFGKLDPFACSIIADPIKSALTLDAPWISKGCHITAPRLSSLTLAQYSFLAFTIAAAAVVLFHSAPACIFPFP
jgi:hypothetical protein